MCLGQTVNVRGRIPQLASPDAAAGYIHNGQTYGVSRFRYGASVPLGEIARRNRAAVASIVGGDSRALHDTDVLFAVHRETERRGQAMHLCEIGDTLYHITNWAPAWRELDLRPALEAEAREARGVRKLRLVVFGDGQATGSVKRCKNPTLPS
jgi:hypothetical protein